MVSTPQSRLELLMELIRIPGVTATTDEDSTARFIYDWLAKIKWFEQNPHYLTLLATPLEGDGRPLHAVAAFVKAARSTRRTIILTGHFDVVDVAVYGALRDSAFDPHELAERLGQENLEPQAASDLSAGNFLFGRGSMDMKAGVAVEMELLRDFAENRNLFDVNLLLLLVPDEENVSAGMRGAIPWLVNLQRKTDLEFLAAINAEPTEAGLPSATCPTVFLGTVGKLMPAFLCLGKESHVGAYYEGVNAALLSSHILALAEGDPELADPAGGECCPSWICLEQKILREGYSVTVPGAAALYFNCFATASSPAKVLGQMRDIAEKAAAKTVEQLRKSFSSLVKMGLPRGKGGDWQISIFSMEEMRLLAIRRLGKASFGERLKKFLNSTGEADPREAGIAIMRELARLAGKDGPLIMYGFLPPYYPPRSCLGAGLAHGAVIRAADDLVAEAKRRFGLTVAKAPFFTGLCDLSYFGFQGNPDELDVLKNNLPGWGHIYSVPLEALAKLDIPVVNFGPSGRDPHKKTERLEKDFSLDRYPVLLEFLINSISHEAH